jgi:hypothetical protein
MDLDAVEIGVRQLVKCDDPLEAPPHTVSVGVPVLLFVVAAKSERSSERIVEVVRAKDMDGVVLRRRPVRLDQTHDPKLR